MLIVYNFEIANSKILQDTQLAKIAKEQKKDMIERSAKFGFHLGPAGALLAASISSIYALAVDTELSFVKPKNVCGQDVSKGAFIFGDDDPDDILEKLWAMSFDPKYSKPPVPEHQNPLNSDTKNMYKYFHDVNGWTMDDAKEMVTNGLNEPCSVSFN